jgi:predicted ABC-type ATPase
VPDELPSTKKIVIVAGPNGAGKTTFAREYLPQEADCPTFINADLIAAGLSPFQPDLAALRAGRLMLEELDRYAAEGRNFAFETTLSGRTYVRKIAAWRAAGYHIKLIYLGLSTPDEAVVRVAERVRQGGHDIPEPTIRRRFAAGLKNFLDVYRHRVDYWLWLDNSTPRAALKEEGHNP